MSTVKGILIAIVVIAVCVGIAYMAIPERKLENKIDYAVNKIDEESRYSLLKSVEDTCRAMMASYQSDVLTYRQYEDSANTEKQEWAEKARARANRTAATYNEYMRKNSYVWADNIPRDIDEKLDYIQ